MSLILWRSTLFNTHMIQYDHLIEIQFIPSDADGLK